MEKRQTLAVLRSPVFSLFHKRDERLARGIYSKKKSQGWTGLFPVVRKEALCLKLRAVRCSDCLRIASCCLVSVFSSRQAFILGFCLQACVTFAHYHFAKDRSMFVTVYI